jgi:hypothetical protein
MPAITMTSQDTLLTAAGNQPNHSQSIPVDGENNEGIDP